jgi:hypothetical protein
MGEINPLQRDEKIVKMKMQTAKVLWSENRKDAAFLVLESIDDPRADTLREKMGFDDEYEVRGPGRNSVSPLFIGAGAIVLVVLSFLLGSFFAPGEGRETTSVQALTEEEIVETLIVPTPAPNESLAQPMIQMTGTASPGQLTRSAIQTQQIEMMQLVDATETAAYAQGTATESVRQTQAAAG